MTTTARVLLFTMLVGAGCGSEQPDPGGGSGGGGGGGGGGGQGGGSSTVNPYFPLKVGNTWEFEVTEPGTQPFKKTQTVERMEAVGGSGPSATVMAFRMLTTKVGGKMNLPDKTVSWQATQGSKIIRYRETSYRAGTEMVDAEEHWAPYKLRMDSQPKGAPLAKGDTWQDTYKETKLLTGGVQTTTMHTDVWTAVTVGMEVTVKAGTFKDCVEVKKMNGTGSDVGKTYIFCPNVGKVKEVGRVDATTRMSNVEELTSYKLM